MDLCGEGVLGGAGLGDDFRGVGLPAASIKVSPSGPSDGVQCSPLFPEKMTEFAWKGGSLNGRASPTGHRRQDPWRDRQGGAGGAAQARRRHRRQDISLA